MFAALNRQDYDTLIKLLISEKPLLIEHENILRYYFSSEIHIIKVEMWGRIHLALILGRLDIVQSFPRTFFPNKADERSFSLQLAAFCGGYLEVIKWLVEHGEFFLSYGSDKKNSLWFGKEFLFKAAKNGNLEAVQWVIGRYLWVDKYRSLLEETDDKQCTPLHYAASGGHLKVVQWLAREKSDMLYKLNIDKDSPLHSAVRRGHPEIVKWIYQEKPSLDAVELLHFAAGEGQLEIVEWIVQQHLSVLQLKSKPIHAAAKRGQLEVVQWLVHPDRFFLQLRSYNSDGNMPIHEAAIGGHLKVIQWFVQQDKDLLRAANETSYVKGYTNYKTLIDFAALNGHYPVVQWLLEQNPDYWLHYYGNRDIGSWLPATRACIENWVNVERRKKEPPKDDSCTLL